MISKTNLKGALRRILTDLYWYRTEAAALRKLEGKDHVGFDFFKVAHTAIFADSLHRLGRILDRHRGAGSFWAIREYDSPAIDAALPHHGLSLKEVKHLSDRFAPIRNQVLAHSDPRVALKPDRVFKRANIRGREMVKITNGLWAALRDYYESSIGEQPPSGDEYSGSDIEQIHADYMRRHGDS